MASWAYRLLASVFSLVIKPLPTDTLRSPHSLTMHLSHVCASAQALSSTWDVLYQKWNHPSRPKLLFKDRMVRTFQQTNSASALHWKRTLSKAAGERSSRSNQFCYQDTLYKPLWGKTEGMGDEVRYMWVYILALTSSNVMTLFKLFDL